MPGPSPKSIEERFLAKVQKTDSCWTWVGAIGPNGYGRMLTAKQKIVSAHRIAYELYKEPIPDGLLIRHTCDNKRCVNPDHLLTGTQLENAADMIERGRENPHCRKKTHCPSGHPYSPENTKIGSNGGRVCITCQRRQGRDYRRALRIKYLAQIATQNG